MFRPCNNCNPREIKYKLDPESGRPSSEKEMKNMMKRGLSMIQSFALSMASRGLKNKKVDIPVKKLRVLSCFGDKNTIGPCKHLRTSSTEGKFYCGGCNCGDKKNTWLVAEEEEYSKLDYPKLNCPLKMPGFSNYELSEEYNKRKSQIETYDIDKLNLIEVTSPNPEKDEN